MCALVMMVFASLARAESPPRAPASLSYENLTFVRINPLGAGDEFRLRYKLGLYGTDRPALAQNYFAVVTPVMLAPSFVRPGLGVEVQPLSLLRFYVGYEPTAYFGAVNSLHSYTSPNADYGYGAATTGPPNMAGDVYSAVVHQVVLGATLQAAWRFLGFRSTWRAQYLDGNTRNNDPVFYDPLYGTLLPRQGWVVHGETDLVYRSRFGLTAGLRYAMTATWYPDSAWQPGEAHTNLNTPIQKLGPLVAYTFFEHNQGRFDAPTLLLLCNWYLEDRYRTGQLVSQAMPMIGLGFAFRGTLFEGAPR
jgi:hypothetical protein